MLKVLVAAGAISLAQTAEAALEAVVRSKAIVKQERNQDSYQLDCQGCLLYFTGPLKTAENWTQERFRVLWKITRQEKNKKKTELKKVRETRFLIFFFKKLFSQNRDGGKRSGQKWVGEEKNINLYADLAFLGAGEGKQKRQT
jgi:hypothetical protein